MGRQEESKAGPTDRKIDLEADPDEMQNLAVEPRKHGELLLAMNDKMNALIDSEVDEPDDGSFLPGKDANRAATKFDP